MRAWRLEVGAGTLQLTEVPTPVVRPGSVVVQVDAAPVVSYLREYAAGKLPFYNPLHGEFTPGTSGIGMIERVGPDVYTLRPGQRVLLTGHYTSAENVPEPAQALLGITAPPESVPVLETWRDGPLPGASSCWKIRYSSRKVTATIVPGHWKAPITAGQQRMQRSDTPQGGSRAFRLYEEFARAPIVSLGLADQWRAGGGASCVCRWR